MLLFLIGDVFLVLSSVINNKLPFVKNVSWNTSSESWKSLDGIAWVLNLVLQFIDMMNRNVPKTIKYYQIFIYNFFRGRNIKIWGRPQVTQILTNFVPPPFLHRHAFYY